MVEDASPEGDSGITKVEFLGLLIQSPELLRDIRPSCPTDATKVLPEAANRASRLVYRSIDRHRSPVSDSAGAPQGNLPLRAGRPVGHLLGKRFLLIVVLVLALCSLVR